MLPVCTDDPPGLRTTLVATPQLAVVFTSAHSHPFEYIPSTLYCPGPHIEIAQPDAPLHTVVTPTIGGGQSVAAAPSSVMPLQLLSSPSQLSVGAGATLRLQTMLP